MRDITQAPAARVIVLGLLVAGWLAGLLVQRQSAIDTTYADVSPPLLLLGCGLFLLAGMAGRLVRPRDRRARVGVVAAWIVLAAILAGYGVLAAIYVNPFHAGESGETWVSLLLESWFWVGMPLLVSGVLGALGWWIVEAVAGATETPFQP